jgi:hypothetical protein
MSTSGERIEPSDDYVADRDRAASEKIGLRMDALIGRPATREQLRRRREVLDTAPVRTENE